MSKVAEAIQNQSIKNDGAGQLECARYAEALEDAERLLKYAAEVGMEVDAGIRDGVLAARAARAEDWNETIVANLLESLTKLAAMLKPVTADSLKASSHDSSPVLRTYWIVAISLAVFIVPFSVASFVTSALSDAIKKDIASANELAVRLNGQLASSQGQGPGGQTAASTAKNETVGLSPGISRTDVVAELQTFASTIRSIDSRARQLNLFIFNGAKDPFGEIRGNPTELKKKLQLPVPLADDLATVSNERIQVYQDVRYLGQSAVDAVAVFYGAITIGILPVLYALLGTCAYLLRSYEQDMRNRTFLPSHADFPRFMIAAIAGAVVGLFNNFTISQGASIPPLAIAFLVGYAVDVFFSFLEGLIQAFTKNKSAAPPQAPRVP
jgi:hypothetical protein